MNFVEVEYTQHVKKMQGMRVGVTLQFQLIGMAGSYEPTETRERQVVRPDTTSLFFMRTRSPRECSCIPHCREMQEFRNYQIFTLIPSERHIGSPSFIPNVA